MKKVTTVLLALLLLIPVVAPAGPVVAAANPFDDLRLTATSCRRWSVLVDDLVDHATNDPEALYHSYVEREVKQERARVSPPATDAQRESVDQARARFEATTRALAKMAWDNRNGKPHSTANRAYKLCVQSLKSRKAPQEMTKPVAH
jgi:hypothetical protein